MILFDIYIYILDYTVNLKNFWNYLKTKKIIKILPKEI